MKRIGEILFSVQSAAVAFALLAASPVYAENGHSAGQDSVVCLTLEQCRELALRNNAAVLNAGLDVVAARAQKQEAVAGYFPKVSVTAMAFYAFDPFLELGLTDILGDTPFVRGLSSTLEGYASQYGFSTVYSTLKKGVMANVSAIQPVFAGGRIITGNKMARLGMEAASLKQEIQLRTTAEEVESGYWQIVSLEEKIECLKKTEELLDTLYRDVLSASGAGLALETDLLQVRLKINELKAGRIRLENGLKMAKMNYFNSIGVEYNPYTTFGQSSAPSLDNIRLTDDIAGFESPEYYYMDVEDVAASQEETRLLDLSVESKRLEKRMALGEALPQIAVGASYGYNNVIDKGAMNGLVFGMVQIPLSDWGGTARKLQRLDAQMQKAENDREYLGRQLVLQVHKLWLDLNAAWEQLQVSLENRDMSRSLMEQMRVQYDAGMVSVSEFLQTETAYAQAESELLDSQIAYRTALRAWLDKSDAGK